LNLRKYVLFQAKTSDEFVRQVDQAETPARAGSTAAEHSRKPENEIGQTARLGVECA
jgi:hypothetical protein